MININFDHKIIPSRTSNKFLFLILIGFLGLSCITTSKGRKNIDKQPNILFIAVDDLKPLLGSYGNQVIKTPNIDKLSSQATVFLNNHCQQAVCGPSRSSLLTGLYPDHTKVWDLQTLIRDKNPEILTLPQHFKNNGYQTVAFGKIFDLRSVDKGHDKKSWTIPYKNIDPSEMEASSSLVDAENRIIGPALGHYQKLETKKLIAKFIKEGRKNGVKNPRAYALSKIKPVTECIEIEDEGYMDGIIAKRGIETLSEFAGSEKPFFLALGFKKPHLPFVAPKKYWDMYESDEVAMAQFQNKAKGSPSQAYHNSGEIGKYTDDEGNFIYQNLKNERLSEDVQKHLIHGYYASVSYIDAQVGKVLDKLRELSLDDNTIVILWGDHGWHLGDHGLWCKHSNFEQATRSPMILSIPDVDGQKISTPSSFVDIFPTLSDLAGIELPSHLEGNNLAPLIKGKESRIAKYAVSQYRRGEQIMGYAIRSDRYRFVKWIQRDYRNSPPYNSGKTIATELYDYEKDPNETVNQANETEYQQIVEEHEEYLQEFFVKMSKANN